MATPGERGFDEGLGGTSPADAFNPFGAPSVSATVNQSAAVSAAGSVFSKLEGGLNRTLRLLDAVAKKAKVAKDALTSMSQGVDGGGGSSTDGTVAARSAAQNTMGLALRNIGSSVSARAAGINQRFNQFATMGQAGGRGGAAALGMAAFEVGQRGIAALDNRVNNSYNRLLEMDRLGVLYQQTQGISQQQYFDQYRQPLAQFRLGQGGISSLLALQARTGISARGQAGAIQGMAAASGYAYNTQDFIQMIQTLANPMVNNRMTMTLGTGIYGPGGTQRNLSQVFQSVVRGAGLTNERVVRSGMQIGSLTRARLSALGIPEDMQDLVLQYAQENVQFQKKTSGRMGMYDPEQMAHRRIMGIENTLASQREETTRLAEMRDEKFYNRQKDNMVSLEKNTQALINLQTSMEEFASGLIGARISTRGHMVGRVLRGVAGIGMMGVGAALALGGGATGIGALAGAGLFSAGATTTAGAFTGGGDGTEGKGKGKGSAGMSSAKTKLSNFSNLNDKFRSRLESLINASGGRVWVGTGYRSSAQQESLFKSRYSRTNEKTGIYWDGSYWKNTSGAPDAAPPGMSMHEIGLAVDMQGDMQWLQQNAERFGLKTFADVNNEPWHVQPLELPNSRRMYEKAGAPWGIPANAAPFDDRSTFVGNEHADAVSKGLGGAGGQVAVYSQLGIAESIKAVRASNTIDGGFTPSGRMTSTGPSSADSQSFDSRKPQVLNGRDLAKLLFEAGFRGNDLVKALAISHRESRWNTHALNPNAETGDMSYGLFQINMRGNLGPYRRKLFGLSKDEELYNPMTNISAAYKLYTMRKKEGKDGFFDWGGYKDYDPTYDTNLKMAARVAQVSGYLGREGDPAMPSRGGGGGSTVVTGGNITIAPNIYIQSVGNNEADARKAANEVANIVSERLRIEALRRS